MQFKDNEIVQISSSLTPPLKSLLIKPEGSDFGILFANIFQGWGYLLSNL